MAATKAPSAPAVLAATKHITFADMQTWDTAPVELVAPLGNYKQAKVVDLYATANALAGAPTVPGDAEIQLSDDAAFNSVAQNIVLRWNLTSVAVRGVPLGYNANDGTIGPTLLDGFMQEGGCGLYIWGSRAIADWNGGTPPTIDLTALYIVINTDGLGVA